MKERDHRVALYNARNASSDLIDPVVPLSTHSCPYCWITFLSQWCLYSHLRTHLHPVYCSCNGECYSTTASETSSDLTDPDVPLPTLVPSAGPCSRVRLAYIAFSTHTIKHYVDWSFRFVWSTFLFINIKFIFL